MLIPTVVSAIACLTSVSADSSPQAYPSSQQTLTLDLGFLSNNIPLTSAATYCHGMCRAFPASPLLIPFAPDLVCGLPAHGVRSIDLGRPQFCALRPSPKP